MDCYVLGQEGFQKHILYLHGGGYVNQPFDQHWTFLQEICRRTHSRIVVPIYPKAPNYTVVTSFEKVLPLYERMLETTSPSDMTIMGDSAGGGFALALAQLLKEKELPQPDDIILLSPWLDITMQNPDIDALDLESKDPMLGKEALIQWGEAYRGNIEPSNYLLSPINGSLTGLGRLSIFIGTHELFLADALKFKTLCEEQKIPLNYYEYDKMNHVFPVYPIPEAKQARQQIAEIILT